MASKSFRINEDLSPDVAFLVSVTGTFYSRGLFFGAGDLNLEVLGPRLQGPVAGGVELGSDLERNSGDRIRFALTKSQGAKSLD